MRPTKKHMKVDRYVEPVEFDRWKQVAEDMGFLYVASGPLVRSSYKVSVNSLFTVLYLIFLQAGEYFIENVLRNRGAEKRTQNLIAQQAMTNSTLFE
jgi:lipoic acid synthetase